MKDSIEKVKQWLVDMQCKAAIETDSTERMLMQRRIDHIQRNLKHCFIPRIEKSEHHYFCKECGEIEFGGYLNKMDLEEKQLCFGCHHWLEKEQEYLDNPSKTLIINGEVYGDAGATSGRDTHYNGFAGSVFHIRMLDGSREWSTNNLWCGGDIPKKYKTTTMRDNAEFVKEKK